MKFITDPIVKSARDVAALSARLVEDGVGFLKTSLGSIPIFAGTKVYVAEEGLGADETHYFLVPFRAVERGYAIATRRVLPEGIGPENDLPKRRVFHLPDGTRLETLEKFLLADLAGCHAASADAGSDTADRLEKIADGIDTVSVEVTAGLVLVGTVVAISTPLLGIGIAASALLPGVGAILSSEGLKKVGGALRRKRANEIGKDAGKLAQREMKKLKPELHENALLSLLEQALSTSDPAFDPAMHGGDPPGDVAGMRVSSLTAEAILITYEGILHGRASAQALDDARLDAPDLLWLRSLESLVVERNQLPPLLE